MAGAGTEVGRISIKVTPDTDSFRRDLAAQLKAIENELKAHVEVDVDVNTEGAKANFDRLLNEMKLKGAKGVNIKTDIDKNGLSGFLSGAGGAAGGASGALGGFSHSLAIVGAVAAVAAPALALIEGVLISLPALAAAVALPIAAIALGMDGIKKAASVLGPAFTDLKASMSAIAQEKFTPVFTKLLGIFPTLAAELPKVTSGVADLAQGLVNAVTSAPGLDAIKNTIQNVATALSAGAPGIQSFTSGILQLASSVSSHLPGLATFLDQFAARFDSWVAKISKKDWFGNSPLDTAIGSLKDSLKGIFDLIAQLGETGFNLLSDPNMGKNIKTVFDSLSSFVKDAGPALGKLFEDIASALAQITGLIDKATASGLLGGKTPKQDNPGDIGGVSTTPDGSNAWDASKKSWELFVFAMKTDILVISAFIQTQISAAFSAVSTIGSGIWTTIVTAAQAAWAEVTSVVSTAISTISSILSGISNVISTVWSGLGAAASSAWAAVVAAVQQAMAQALAAVVTGVGQIVAEAAAIGGKVAAAVGNLGSALVAAGQALMNGLLSGIKAGLNAVLDFASGIAAKIAAVKGPINHDKVVLSPNGQALMQGLQDGIEGGFQGVLDRAKSMAQEISDAINSGGPLSLNLQDDLKKQMSEIGLESDDLKNQLNGTTDKGTKAQITDQRKQLQTVRDQLKLQSDQLGFSDKYGDNLKQQDSLMGDTLNKMVDAGKGFAESNIKQAMGDLGIGGGAITAAADQGIGFLTSMLTKGISGLFGGKTEIHVNSLEEAQAAQQNQQNKQALQFTRR